MKGKNTCLVMGLSRYFFLLDTCVYCNLQIKAHCIGSLHICQDDLDKDGDETVISNCIYIM